VRIESRNVRCPDCGTELGSDAGTEGLCPRCLLSLVLVRSELDPAGETGSVLDSRALTPDHTTPVTGPVKSREDRAPEAPAPGRILGEPDCGTDLRAAGEDGSGPSEPLYLSIIHR
jgi:hypothetical protein